MNTIKYDGLEVWTSGIEPKELPLHRKNYKVASTTKESNRDKIIHQKALMETTQIFFPNHFRRLLSEDPSQRYDHKFGKLESSSSEKVLAIVPEKKNAKRAADIHHS